MNKFKSYLAERKYFFAITAVVLLGFLLRFAGLDKSGGFWLDEAYCWYGAKLSFPFGILEHLYNKDLHAPFYFFLLHFWMKLFGEADLTLKLLSVAFGTLNIPVFYFIGKELKSQRGGLAAAAFAAVNSLLIYYSQEVKFYSLIALLASLSLLFVLKAVNNPAKKNYIWLAVVNAAILYTFTIGFLFIAIEAFVFGIYIYKKCPENFRNFAFSYLLSALSFIPHMPMFLHQTSVASTSLIDLMNQFRTSHVNIMLIVQNWFTPAIVGPIGVDQGYYNCLAKNGNPIQIFLLIIMPAAIALTGIIKSLIKKNTANLLVYIGILFMLAETAATLIGKFALLSRYTLPVLPCFIAVAGYGLADLKNKKLSNLLIGAFIFLNLIFLLFSPASPGKISCSSISAYKMPRHEAYKTVAIIMKDYKVNKNDIIFMFYGGQFLNKYYPLEKNQVVPFYLMDAFVFDYKNYAKILCDDDIAEKLSRKNSFELLKPYLASENASENFAKYLDKNVFGKIKKGGRLFVVVSRGIAFYNPIDLKMITQDKGLYKNQSMFFMLSSKITNDVIVDAQYKLNYKSRTNAGVWEVFEFEK